MIDYVKKIQKLKDKFDGKVVISAHHYQHPDIVKLADFVGDSYKLAVDCSKVNAEYIVFCGVRFMAEGAAILAKKNQKILLPKMSAGCPLADFIDGKKMAKVLEKIEQKFKISAVPVVYMNSYTDAKNICGKHGGAVCTSSNAQQILEYYFAKGQSVFFAPDFNLGINTARKMNLKEMDIIKINKNLTFSQNSKMPKLFIWDGNCRVHKRFIRADVEQFKAKYPNGKLIVHPECDEEIVNLADVSGSTSKIFSEIENSANGSVWAVGTEYYFVKRIAEQFPQKTIIPLRQSICANMAKINLQNLYETLKSIDENIENLIVVNEKQNARKSLQKMIEIVEG